jgi:hypothetical protein
MVATTPIHVIKGQNSDEANIKKNVSESNGFKTLVAGKQFGCKE